MKKSLLLFAISIAFCVPSLAQSALYPLPASWSFRAVASFSQPRFLYVTPEEHATLEPEAGDIVILATSPNPVFQRWASDAWVTIGGSGGSSVATTGEIVYSDDSEPTGDYLIWLNTLTRRVMMRRYPKPDPTGIIPTFESGQASVTSGGITFTATYSESVFLPNTSNPGSAFDSDWNSDHFSFVYPYGSQYYASEAAYLAIDTGTSTTSVEGISVLWDMMFYAPGWKCQYSTDNSTWLTAVDVTGYVPEVPLERKYYVIPVQGGVTARYWRISCVETTSGQQSQAFLYDFQLYSTLENEKNYDFADVFPPASITVDNITVQSLTATPTIPATGTLWMDGNMTPPKMKAWDGTSWNALW